MLELLSQCEYTVAEMLPQVGIEPAHLSQQLAVLRRANLVTSRKEGSSVRYALTSPHVAELLAVARLILTRDAVGASRAARGPARVCLEVVAGVRKVEALIRQGEVRNDRVGEGDG